MHRVFALARGAHAKTFDGFDEQHRRLALVLDGGCISGIDLLRVVATTAQIPNIVVANLGDHLQGARISAKEMFAHIRAIVGLESLVVAVHGFHHDAAQCAVFVAGNQGVPVATPNQFEHVPTSTTEFTL